MAYPLLIRLSGGVYMSLDLVNILFQRYIYGVSMLKIFISVWKQIHVMNIEIKLSAVWLGIQ